MRVETATKTVQDPYNVAGRLLVTINTTEDAVEWMMAKKLLSDIRYKVAVRFRNLHEACRVGGCASIDYTKPLVDGGVPGDVFTDQFISANKKMAEIFVAIGQENASFLSVLVGHGKRFGDVAIAYSEAYRMPEREARGFVRGKLCEALDVLGVHWGMLEAAGPDWSRGMRSVRDVAMVRGAIDIDDELEIYDMRELT